jgi:hypothetical protein
VGAVVRARLRARRRRRAVAAIVALWGLAEAAIAGACLQVMVLAVGLAAVRLAWGLPLAWGTLVGAADRALAILSWIAGAA